MTIQLKTAHTDRFVDRHIGPSDAEIEGMLQVVGFKTLDELVDATVPPSIRLRKPLDIPRGRSEFGQLAELEGIAAQNEVWRSYIGMGYHGTFTPPVILRNILLNPGWYTQYTPYQAEIAQGRLEALLNFQTMIIDLTGLEIANASLLDEGTAAAEAMAMAWAVGGRKEGATFFVADDCHPQTIDVVRTRAIPLGIDVVVAEPASFDWNGKKNAFGALWQYPATDGSIHDLRPMIAKAHEAGALAIVAADILALTLLTPPGELGADVAVGNTQRFGVPMGYGGPHAAYFATKQQFVRQMPGRLIGVAEDAQGRRALRMALQTREQHIRREKATSNICTAQVLLAVMASMYAVYHGPKGLKAIAERVHALAGLLAKGIARLGFEVGPDQFFDTFYVRTGRKTDGVLAASAAKKMNFRRLDAERISISLDEISTPQDVEGILSCFGAQTASIEQLEKHGLDPWPEHLRRKSAFLTHPVFNTHRSETDMQRYIRMLESRDLSLTHSMIPLGSCTMKLNAASEMEAVTWKAFNSLHPFVPQEQARGYARIFSDLEKWLAEITGFAAMSLQPNAGSQGEYAGLLVIRKYHESRGEKHRNVCLIPSSAHGTNPASAVMAGYDVVVVACDEQGNIDLADLEKRAKANSKNLAALMVTYPSTHGVFEEGIQKACEIVHAHGGQVYMDGANMNAQVGLTRPAECGADVCHLNLHKTFCIPHGGGGPGMGPIGVAKHLVDFLPTSPVVKMGGKDGIGAISAAPWGSASILLISWAYISMMGGEGLTKATKIAILNANYVAKRLQSHFPVLYAGKNGTVAHECILDTRQLKKSAGIEVEDIAKRLMDYGFHAPTISFPVAGTVMIEPTESESKAELDRFCEAMIAIRREIADIESGKQPKEDNLLKNAPHTAEVVMANEWKRPYTREQAAFPAPWVRAHKFWPSVSRINAAAGDRHLVCSCPPIEEYAKAV